LLPDYRILFPIFIIVALLSACVLPPARKLTPIPKPLPPTIAEKKDQEQITPLLDEAYLAFEDNRLTTPLDDNAYYRYLQVLSIDPENASANQGIAEIVEKYLEWAISSAEQETFKKAIDYLNKARSVDESHPNIPSVAKLIANLRSINRKTYPLSIDALNNGRPRLIEALHSIAMQAEEHNAMVVITARNDQEGRWIYQQLNDATPRRIRATFELGRNPRIRLLYK
jgi:hypothetical protein|tara:strand:+ start:2125 stop:2805 length:681 start_codon:yes stop_codon:yes gene_type:complete